MSGATGCTVAVKVDCLMGRACTKDLSEVANSWYRLADLSAYDLTQHWAYRLVPIIAKVAVRALLSPDDARTLR
jgi:hypothetical protein